MGTRSLSNISKSKFESFLELVLCSFIHDKKGHCKYTRADLGRPIVIQNHVDPIPEFIIKSNLRTLNYSRDDFFDILEGTKYVERKGNTFLLISRIKS
jgi:hypothetical protein